MSATIIGWASCMSQQLRAAKKTLQDVISDPNLSMCPNDAKVEILEQDISEIITLLRSWKNGFAPINRVPPKILGTIPDFLGKHHKDGGTIALTHVCRAWREVFISRPSLWTDLRWKGAKKTQAHLERSKSSPVSLFLEGKLSPRHPFFQVIPCTIGRLESLTIRDPPEHLDDIARHLSNPEPFLERLELGSFSTALPTLFAGDFSSLRSLWLWEVRTELPWRNMVNLTSVDLEYVWLMIPITCLLDFFESAPRLHRIRLIDTVSSSGGQDGRLVSLASLKRMKISVGEPCAPFLDHLSIPVGAKLDIVWVSLDPPIYENLFPKSLDNFRNLSNFTVVSLDCYREFSCAKFAGPNGELSVTCKIRKALITEALGFLARLGSSTTEWLSICGGGTPAIDAVHGVLLPMQDLHTLSLSKCETEYTLIHFLSPQPQPSSVVFCPKLKKLDLSLRSGNEAKPAIQNVMRMAASRASRGAKLKTIGFWEDRSGFDPEDVSELEKHVSQVEFGIRTVQKD